MSGELFEVTIKPDGGRFHVRMFEGLPGLRFVISGSDRHGRVVEAEVADDGRSAGITVRMDDGDD